MNKTKIEGLHTEFVEVIRPLLKANGRNSISNISQYFSRNVRSGIDERELAERLLFNARRSRKDRALVIWASDFKVIHQEQALDFIVVLIKFYKDRAALTELEQEYYEQLRKTEVAETFGGDIA